MSLFSSEEERRVSDAITHAERKTSGEVVVVVAARSDTYLYISPLIGALVSLFACTLACVTWEMTGRSMVVTIDWPGP